MACLAGILFIFQFSLAAETSPSKKDIEYYFQKPGEIVFTQGTVIKGKVERPQVVIIIQKEKIKQVESTFEKSFKSEILKPLQDDGLIIK